MSVRTLSILSVSLAVVVAAVCGAVIHSKRATIALAEAETAQANADVKAAEARAAEKAAESEAAKARMAKENRQRTEKETERLRQETENLRIEERTATENRKAKAEAAKTAEAEAAKARDLKEAESLKLKTAKVEREKAKAEAEKAAAAAAEAESRLALEKQKSDKVIAEAKLLELRQIDLVTMERELLEWKRDLEERERALTPEKTVADLSWAGGTEDSIIDAEGNVRKQVKVKHDPENDLSTPLGSRALARAERLSREENESATLCTREKVIGALEALYVEAMKENLVIEAEYIKSNILAIYPDWKFKVKKEAEK